MNPPPVLPKRAQSTTGTGLLISARSIAEADLVVAAGASILDFKEPSNGPLASTLPEIWKQAARFADQIDLSAALGEFTEANDIAAQVPSFFSYAKAGPSGCVHGQSLVASWAKLRSILASRVGLVAVAYADHLTARCLPPLAIFEQAAAQGMHTWLIDTFDKRWHSTIQLLAFDELRAIATLAHKCKAEWVLAGSIELPHLQMLAKENIFPSYVGVRGAVCDGPRNGTLNRDKIRQWNRSLTALSQIAGD